MDLRPSRESLLLAPVAGHFFAEGYACAAEVDIAGRIADLLAVRGSEVVGVELKLKDWRAAGRQATAYQLGCHRTYVALPLLEAAKLHASFADEFRKRFPGCGLIGVNHPAGDLRFLEQAGTNPRLLPFLADRLSQHPALQSRADLEARRVRLTPESSETPVLSAAPWEAPP
ncbi:MAG: hypothetical protein ACYDDF_12130 [Thermoplasmatota archaeon]